MKCRKCGKKMEKESKRGFDSYYCRSCGAQAKKVSRKSLLRETSRDLEEYFRESNDEEIDKN